MKKLLALLSMLTCGWVSAATSPVTFEEAVNVLVRSTQSAYVTPSGLAFRFCASEEEALAFVKERYFAASPVERLAVRPLSFYHTITMPRTGAST